MQGIIAFIFIVVVFGLGYACGFHVRKSGVVLSEEYIRGYDHGYEVAKQDMERELYGETEKHPKTPVRVQLKHK